MIRLLVLALAATLAPVAAADVWTSVYRCDGVTPLAPVDPNQAEVYPRVMVGTRLAIVISSDIGEFWAGGLIIPAEDLEYGSLAGRAIEGEPFRYSGSSLKAAGRKPLVADNFDEAGVGFLFTTHYSIGPQPAEDVATPGDWFVFDYHARQVGQCRVQLYDLSRDRPETLTFTHVPSRDLNGDTVVDLRDFAVLASRWQSPADSESTGTPDLDADGRVGIKDIALFSEYWLERTDCADRSAAPNADSEEPVRGTALVIASLGSGRRLGDSEGPDLRRRGFSRSQAGSFTTLRSVQDDKRQARVFSNPSNPRP